VIFVVCFFAAPLREMPPADTFFLIKKVPKYQGITSGGLLFEGRKTDILYVLFA
jgi:hypothetical protein